MKGKHEGKKHKAEGGELHGHTHEHGHEHSHAHGHDHAHGDMKVNMLTLARLVIAALLFAVGLIVKASNIVELALFLAAFLIAGYDVMISGVMELIKERAFDENLLMSVAGIGAFAIGEYAEGAVVMILYHIGEMLQDRAVASSRRSVSELIDMRPDTINVIENGVLKELPAEEVQPGLTMVIKPGERVALDCTITEGASSMDTSALTGESLPRAVDAGDEVFAGSVNIGAIVYARVERALKDSAVSRILELVEKAESTKAKSEKLMSRFARIYTPVVIAMAVLIAFLPPLLAGQALATWVHRGLIFLVISCPCAIVISLPLTYFSGIGGAARCGILFKSANALDAMSNVGSMVFDKTGTLTTGKFKIASMRTNGISEESFLMLTAYAEAFSDHPMALAIKEAYGKSIDMSRVKKASAQHGRGVTTVIDEVEVFAGNARFMSELGVGTEGCESGETTVFVAIGGRLAGYITLADTIKAEAADTMRDLKNAGVKKLALLTGDRSGVAQTVAETLGVSEVHAECMPEDKMNFLGQIINETNKNGQKTVFVGDGINDAPALKAADIGIAMGGLGSDSAIEAADVVIMDDKLSHLTDAIIAAKNTKKLIMQNIVISLAIKLVVMVLGILGIATMWFAVFADVGTAIIAIINATRALHIESAH